MDTPEHIIRKHFPALIDKELLNEIVTHGSLRKFTANTVLIEIGAYIKQMPLLLSGSIKVSREDSEGKELLLYYLNGGDTCAMSLPSYIGDQKSTIRATVLDDTEILMLPTSKMDEWMREYDSWKNFIFQAYQKRFDELLQTIDSIAFMKMDERLAKYLNDRSEELGSKTIGITHQDIANDLNTSREVVSRLLKQLEKLGKIKLHRFKVELLGL